MFIIEQHSVHSCVDKQITLYLSFGLVHEQIFEIN